MVRVAHLVPEGAEVAAEIARMTDDEYNAVAFMARLTHSVRDEISSKLGRPLKEDDKAHIGDMICEKWERGSQSPRNIRRVVVKRFCAKHDLTGD